MRWPPELKERVAALHEAGLSAEQIRNEIDLGISRNAIIGALNRIAGYRRGEHPKRAGDEPEHRRVKLGRPPKPRPPKPPPTIKQAKAAAAKLARPPEPLPIVPPPIAPTTRGPVTLIGHHEGQCRFIVAEPGNCKFPLGGATGNHWFYCGAPVFKHSSWCAKHYAIVCG